MRIVVKIVSTSSCKTIVLDGINVSDSVDHVKAVIERIEGIAKDGQRLAIGEKQLEDGRTLGSYFPHLDEACREREVYVVLTTAVGTTAVGTKKRGTSEAGCELLLPGGKIPKVTVASC